MRRPAKYEKHLKIDPPDSTPLFGLIPSFFPNGNKEASFSLEESKIDERAKVGYLNQRPTNVLPELLMSDRAIEPHEIAVGGAVIHVSGLFKFAKVVMGSETRSVFKMVGVKGETIKNLESYFEAQLKFVRSESDSMVTLYIKFKSENAQRRMRQARLLFLTTMSQIKHDSIAPIDAAVILNQEPLSDKHVKMLKMCTRFYQ